MPKKKKKSWKEIQRERQSKQQTAQKTYEIQREVETKRKPRQWPKRKILFGISLIVLIVGIYAIWQYAAAPMAIFYIRADGKIDPPTSLITQTENSMYIFAADVKGSIVVERDNIIIDGANHILHGDSSAGSKGIILFEKSRVTIRNFAIKDFETGIYINSGIGNAFSQNELSNNQQGISLEDSESNIIEGNTLANNQVGIDLTFNSINNTIKDNTLNENFDAINLNRSTDNTIQENNIKDSKNGGIGLARSIRNNILDNTIRKTPYGISLTDSSENTISRNNVANSQGGIGISNSFENTITDNQVSASQESIRLEDSARNIITRNSITGGVGGIGLFGSSNNTITENLIKNNSEYGISLTLYSDENRIYHNSFITNSAQAYAYTSQNIWDNGFPSGGNYWSDFQTQNPFAEEIEDSSVWNTPYFINEENLDIYPLINPKTPS